ncbi:MAG: hypothetical protein K0R00_153 [Herbinix sp.]|nr:hypothetical protein [Herbinix sp.]
MRTIYGLKMFTLEDITGKTGGRPSVCNLLKEDPSILDRFEDGEKMVVDTGLHQNFTVYNMAKCLKFVFVSIDLFEEKLILDNFTSNISDVLKMLTTVSRTEKVERIINKHIDSYEKYSNKYSGEALLKEPCFMFVFDNDTNKLVDVYTAIPGEVIYCLSKPIEYECSVCGKIEQTENTSFNNFLPKMYYKSSEKEIDYRCEDHKEHDYSHVGE